jgi:4-amino-4-deoxy-L-arabinose transferase-like glycosyltransferase
LLLAAAVLRLWQISVIPRGLWLDEAFFLLEGQKIAHGQGFPIYFEADHGVEPVLPYLCALAELVLGHVSWAGRLVMGWLGVIGVACVMRLAKDLFPGRTVWPMAGLALTFLYWDINFSRFTNQPELTTIFTATTLAAFWHGLRTGRRWAFPLAGLCMGLGLSSYAASRFIPLIFGCTWLAGLISLRGRRRAVLTGGLVTALTALLVYSPLLWFFVHNPQWFFLRFNEITGATLGPGNSLLQLREASLNTLSGLFLSGDTNWRHNLAGRPALDISQAILFLLGLAVALRRWRHPETWALVAWLVIGLLPSVVTADAPHFGRTTMAIPVIALIIGLGSTTLWRWLRSWPARSLLALVLLLSAAFTVYDYFWRWASSPELDEAFVTDEQQIAQVLRAAPANEALYATPLHINPWDVYWTIEYLVGEPALSRLREFDGNQCTLLPAYTSTGATYAVIEPEDVTTASQLAKAFPSLTRSAVGPLTPDSTLAVYHIPAGQTAQLLAPISLTATFGDLVQLQGYGLDADFRAGGSIHVTAVWKTSHPTPALYKIFLHLRGKPQLDGNVVYAQDDTEPCAFRYSSLQWHPGELIVDHYALALPENLPAGSYSLGIGWYNENSGRLPITQASNQASGDTLVLGQLQLPQP